MEDGSEEKLKVNLRWTVEAILLYGLWDRTSVTEAWNLTTSLEKRPDGGIYCV